MLRNKRLLLIKWRIVNGFDVIWLFWNLISFLLVLMKRGSVKLWILVSVSRK